ncbi:MAG: cytochrome b N-terminal domain-containing protein [Patescibacteria group bacterium]|nr:cytochrome b N-terminal domain-containing protein [Patescibacteria group bacterium]
MNDQASSEGFFSVLRRALFIPEVPSYGNSVFYSLGFLAMTSLTLLVISGVVMVFFGSAWWITAPWGIFMRSIHLWAAQILMVILLLHVAVVFLTSGFKAPRRLTWVLGGFAFLLILIEAEFGYDLRGDFSSQYRALQGADFWNGAFLGRWINTLNHAQAYGIHVIDIPVAIFAFIFLHYALVKIRGIAKPYRSDAAYTMVPADHYRLFARGGALAAVILMLALAFPSPFVEPETIGGIAENDPNLVAQTLLSEFTRTSDTATYLDSINPYAFDTRAVYVTGPYAQYLIAAGGSDALAEFSAKSADEQGALIADAQQHYQQAGSSQKKDAANPLVSAVDALVTMAKSGLYQPAIDAENSSVNPTYSLRFIADTGVLDAEAEAMHMTTEQWGMMREERGTIAPGAWWLAPIGFLDHTLLANDPNGDRDGAELLGALALFLILFPYIPYLSRLPEKMPLARMIWRAGGK